MEPVHFRIYGDYAGAEPAFYDADQLPWTERLRQNWQVIREEFEAYLAQGGTLRPNFAPDAVQLTGWVGITFFTGLRRYDANCRAFPRTVAILESIPNLASAFINVLAPDSALPPHFGDTNVAYRTHLGIVVPGGVEECGMQVDGERRGWGEGEVVVFNDARKHSVWNRSARPRVILVCDVLKPQYGGATPRLCGRVLGSIAVMFAQARVPALRQLPAPVLRVLHAAASLPFQAYLLVFGNQRRFAVGARDASLR